MSGIFNLNAGINLSDLYKDLDESKLKKIEEAAVGGFTSEELASLKNEGIDVVLIQNNSTTSSSSSGKKTDEDVQSKANELKQKYNSAASSFSGDRYSADNPEVRALSKMLDDYALAELAKEGFTKTQRAIKREYLMVKYEIKQDKKNKKMQK